MHSSKSILGQRFLGGNASNKKNPCMLLLTWVCSTDRECVATKSPLGLPKSKIYIIIALALFFCSPSFAACSGSSPIWTAASAAQADVQACVAVASNGDTILVPAGTVSYSSAVNIPSSLCVTINGQGAVTITSSVAFLVNVGTVCETRITGFTFSSSGGNPPGTPINVTGPANGFVYRIDHNTFPSALIVIALAGDGPGLIDHNTFTSTGGNDEMIHNLGTDSTGGSAGWIDNIIPGGPNMVFIEDNTFLNSGSASIYAAVQSFYGARNVIRHNAIHFGFIDQHGTAGMKGARWWEIYQNTYYLDGDNQYAFADLRAGSGMYWGNVVSGSGSGTHNVLLREEDSNAWPQAYQVGSGINGYTDAHNSCASGTLNSSPAYLWSMDPQMNISSSGTVQLNRDFFVSANQPASLLRQEQTGDTCSTTYNYVPFTYPHPAQGTSGSGPAPPTNINAVAQ